MYKLIVQDDKGSYEEDFSSFDEAREEADHAAKFVRDFTFGAAMVKKDGEVIYIGDPE